MIALWVVCAAASVSGSPQLPDAYVEAIAAYPSGHYKAALAVLAKVPGGRPPASGPRLPGDRPTRRRSR